MLFFCKIDIDEQIFPDRQFELVDLPEIDNPHIILESYMNEKSKGDQIFITLKTN